MEIEAKFRVPDEQTFQRLRGATAMAGFRMGDLSSNDLHDTYLDTAGWDMRANGYACRLRRVGDCYLATVKGLGGVAGAIHRRAEYQVALPEPLPPQQWPACSARELVLRLSGGKPLVVLFTIRQTRESRLLTDRGRTVAELSLDRARVSRREGGCPVDSFLEMEAELLPSGTEGDLDGLVTALEEGWRLQPEGRSKYQRGLDLLYSDSADVPREGG